MDSRQQSIAAAKQRMSNFRLRQPSSSSTPTSIVSSAPLANALHARSHSRNTSITDFAFPTLSSANSLSSDESQEAVTPVPSSPPPRSRPNSHHRRRSSVSTRRESAEMMGVAPPPDADLDAAGDQSELRRLALWALEGKGRSDNVFIGSFNKVEIPELNALDTEVSLDGTQAPKIKPTLSTFSMGSVLAGKRDSFGKLLISSSNSLKDHLHTLMEEEEEEEEVEEVEKRERQELDEEGTPTPPASADNFREEAPSRPAGFPSARPRPANLMLRPLSLTPKSLPLSGTEGLPTPSPTPSPRIAGLKALVLAPSPSPSPGPSISSTSSPRQSLSVSPSSPPKDHLQRRQSISTFNSPTPSAIKRKSSISYKRSDSGNYPPGCLPTPAPTPTSPLPPLHVALPSISSSLTSMAPDLDRPLSPTEQAFLFRSHTSLLSRISDLEQAIAGGHGKIPPGTDTGLSTSTGYRPHEEYNPSKFHEQSSSITKMSTSSEPESFPSDEMLQLVSDLKSERDELMRDADGWRTRVSDLEKQIRTLTKRVEAERRESWVVRERLGLVEVEKKRIKEDLERSRLECRRLEKALRSEEDAWTKVEEERDILSNLLKAEQKKREVVEREVESLRVELEQLRVRAELADADLQALLVTPKVEVTMQMPASKRFNSVDSQISTSSITDVEEYVPVGIRTRKLNAVQEEIEDHDIPRDVTSESGIDSDNDELAHYEDDEDLDDDMMFGDDQTSSSFGSIVRSNSHLLRLDLAGVAPAPAPAHIFVPRHTHSGSMERGWSFPQSRGKFSPALREPPKVDHFFECLDALDAVEADEGAVLTTYDSATAKQFWRGAVLNSDDDDELPPFVLPTQPKEKNWKEVEAAKLSVLTEEEEEECLFTLSGFLSSREMRSTQETDPVTPRAGFANTLQMPPGTPTKQGKGRKPSMNPAIPVFKPYSGSVPILKAPLPPKQISSPTEDLSTTPTAGGTAVVSLKPISPTMIPQPTYSSQPGFVTPRKSRPSTAGSNFIPRSSPSPKSSTTGTRTKSQSITAPAPATKFTPPSTTPMPPVFIPQPKMTNKSFTRSSPLPPKPPLLIPQQTAPPAASPSKQGLTFKLSQQMQSLTSLWSPWSPSSDTIGKAVGPQADNLLEKPKVTRYVSRQRQLERLRRGVQENAAFLACGYCANCRDGVIII